MYSFALVNKKKLILSLQLPPSSIVFCCCQIYDYSSEPNKLLQWKWVPFHGEQTLPCNSKRWEP
ncbi:hypothetical protein V6Z11_A05G112700 [Gossypium hirsutum]